MKKIVFWTLALCLATDLSAQAVVPLDLRSPHQIAVDGNDLYVFDEADYSLHAYTISPFALKWTFGRKGDGPRDFKHLPLVQAQPESLTCTDFTKILWLTKSGEVAKAKEFSELRDFDLNSELLLLPVRDQFVRITADHARMKRNISLLDPGFRTVKDLYEGHFVWQVGSAIDVRTDTLISQGLVFVADTLGFRISVFDDKGTLLRTIDLSRDVEQIGERALLHQYCVSDGRIYATTYKKKDGRTEMIVLDLEGRILQRLYLPLTSIRPKRGVVRYDLFTVGQEKLYELVQNGITGKWELLITDLSPGTR